jgi:type VI secretion system secreted protein Hcp
MKFIQAIVPVLILLLMPALNAQAAEMYMWIDGIPGSSTEESHTNWIECAAFSQMLYEPSSNGIECINVRVEKTMDRTSPYLRERLCNQTVISNIVFEFVRSVAGKPHYYKLVFSNAVIRYIENRNDFYCGSTQEFVRFSYEIVQWTYTAEGSSPEPTTYADVDMQRSGMAQGDQDADGIPEICDSDDDNDGFTDRQEFITGTNPLDPDGFLRVTWLHRQEDDSRLVWTSAENRMYHIYQSGSIDGPYVEHPLSPVPSMGEGETYLDLPYEPDLTFFHIRVIE